MYGLSGIPCAVVFGTIMGISARLSIGEIAAVSVPNVAPKMAITSSSCACRLNALTAELGFPAVSIVSSTSSRPLTPPAALISSIATFAPSSSCWPSRAAGPDSVRMPPTL
jgi:hypothetical protein